jgi:hypothetical protein
MLAEQVDNGFTICLERGDKFGRRPARLELRGLPHRPKPGAPGGFNLKGIVTQDRQPKLAEHFLRERWARRDPDDETSWPHAD